MKRFVEGMDRGQSTLSLNAWKIGFEDNPVRVIEAFVEGLGRASVLRG